MTLTFGSLFAGIGGLDLGLERAGMRCAWQVEVDKACHFVLSRHWPDVPKHGDIAQLKGSEIGAVDLLCGGFPCQDISVAGRRAGLAGKRSGLFFEFARLIDELAPRWIVLENVPGLLSSNGGRDMGTVIGTLAELGYGLAYRVLDAQYFGVPQRRRRVVIVGCLGNAASAASVLFEPESVRGNLAPSRETGARVASPLTRGSSTGRVKPPGRRQEDDANIVLAGLGGTVGGGNDGIGRRTEDDPNLVIGTLSPGAHPGGLNGQDAYTGQLVVSTLQGGGKRGYRLDAEAAGGGQLIPVARATSPS